MKNARECNRINIILFHLWFFLLKIQLERILLLLDRSKYWLDIKNYILNTFFFVSTEFVNMEI